MKQSVHEEWIEVRNVLCVRLDAMGDVLMTVPAMRALKESIPGCRITLLTSRSGGEVGRFISEVDDVLIYEAPWMKATSSHRSPEFDLSFIQTLRKRNFDAAVIFTVYSQNPLPAALLCHLGGVPLRLAHCRENPYHLLTDWRKEREPEELVRHEVQRQLDLVESIGCMTSDPRMRIQIPHSARASAQQKTRSLLGETGASYVILHPGATAESRRYAPERFSAVANHFVRKGLKVLVTGSLQEQKIAEVVVRGAEGSSCHSVAGDLSLAEFAALIESAQLVVSNNTGAVHLASSLRTPVVDIYALTNPQHLPWMVPHRVLSHDVPCKYCYKSVCPQKHNHCLSLIEPASVIHAAESLIQEVSVPLESAL